MRQTQPSLLLCVVLDLVGCLSFTIPFIGELTDVIWAPVASVLFYFLFGRKRFGLQGAVFSFIEEILPGLDFIPTFTIGYVLKKLYGYRSVQQQA